MFRFIRNIFSRLRPIKWINIEHELIGKDELFTMQFDNNWYYSISGNSYYSIHNEVEVLKGGIQFSIIWNRPVVESVDDLNHLDSMLQEHEKVETSRTRLSGLDAIYFMTRYPDSNMDFHVWYLRFENVLFKITYFIFEEEPIEVREAWLVRVKEIINSIKINVPKFKEVKMV